jgi:hypothetical protein
MGLLRGMARTAVVAGTATAVSNRVSRRQAERWGREGYYDQQPPQQQYQYAQQPAAPPPPAAPAAAADDSLTAELERLGSLRNQGLLTDEEFAAAKAKLIGG